LQQQVRTMKRSSGLVALLLPPPLLLLLFSLLSQRRNKLVTATNRRLLDPVPENVLEDNRVFTGCGVAERTENSDVGLEYTLVHC
jgi:hypothetical protein